MPERVQPSCKCDQPRQVSNYNRTKESRRAKFDDQWHGWQERSQFAIQKFNDEAFSRNTFRKTNESYENGRICHVEQCR